MSLPPFCLAVVDAAHCLLVRLQKQPVVTYGSLLPAHRHAEFGQWLRSCSLNDPF